MLLGNKCSLEAYALFVFFLFLIHGHLIGYELFLELICHETLVVLQVLLNVNLEFDYIVEHALDFCVQLFAESIGLESELLVPVM